MPAKTAKQQRFMGAELARARAGKRTKTGMSVTKLEEMARKAPKKKVRKKAGRRASITSARG